VIGIRGQMLDPELPVDIWFDSIKSVANILSKENLHLLKVIVEREPQSVTELAKLTGRAVSNVCRTLKTMEKSNLVVIKKEFGVVIPILEYTSFQINLGI